MLTVEIISFGESYAVIRRGNIYYRVPIEFVIFGSYPKVGHVNPGALQDKFIIEIKSGDEAEEDDE